MARVMSFVMTVFILVPIIAPTMGQAILVFSGWRAIFGSFLVIALISLTWFALRMPETLHKEDRAPFSLNRIISAVRYILKTRTAIGYTIAAGLISGAFLGYLSSSQQIFQEQYDLGDLFPIYFAIIAFAIGLASFLNSRFVMRYGMRFLVWWSLIAILGLALVALAVSFLSNGQPSLTFFMAYLMFSFFCVGILFGNQNSLAMEPLGHLAGIGAAVVGSSDPTACKNAVNSFSSGSAKIIIDTGPVRDTRFASRKAPSGSAENWKELKPATKSNDLSSKGSSTISATRKSPSGTRSRAIASSGSDASMPLTRAPRSAAMAQKMPDPQPISNKAAPSPIPNFPKTKS